MAIKKKKKKTASRTKKIFELLLQWCSQCHGNGFVNRVEYDAASNCMEYAGTSSCEKCAKIRAEVARMK